MKKSDELYYEKIEKWEAQGEREILVDLSNSTIEEDDGGIILSFESVLSG